jgi:hypothetical protein
MAGDPLVLLEPFVEAGEVEHHVAGQVLVGEPEARAGAVRDRDRLARGRVHAERDPRVQHAGRLAIRVRRRRQRGADVLGRYGKGGDDAARLPDERGSRAVDDRFRAEEGPHALLDRLVAKLVASVGQQVLHRRAHRSSRRCGSGAYSWP